MSENIKRKMKDVHIQSAKIKSPNKKKTNK